MPIAFALTFFVYIGLSETLRHGVFGLSASEIETMLHGLLPICALLLLRSDAIWLIRRPKSELYGDPRLTWTWGRSLLGLVAGPVILLAVPLAYGLWREQVSIQPLNPEALADGLLYQTVVVALGVELFFREAVVKAFAGHGVYMVLASVLACFVYHVPEGLPQAMAAAGAGLFYLALRLAGVNILAVALVHAVVVLAQGQIIPLSVPGSEMWTYAICFTVAAAVLSLTLTNMTGSGRREVSHA